jgi:hypothetical protein
MKPHKNGSLPNKPVFSTNKNGTALLEKKAKIKSVNRIYL